MRKNDSNYLLFIMAPIALAVVSCSQKPNDQASQPLVAKASGADLIDGKEAAVPENPLKDAYFGEVHAHTAYSLDAYIGGARLTPSDAYRFAKGADVVVNGKAHNIVKPLDFAAVTDHSEFLGEMYSTQTVGASGHDQESLQQLRNLKSVAEQAQWFGKYVRDNMRSEHPGHPPFYMGPDSTKSAWQVEIDAAKEHYEPGKFSTIVGYEWTSAPNGGNMHRNILFRDMNVPDMPLSALDTPDEEKLWAWMQTQEDAGKRLFAMPHNSNASKGLMFEPVDNAGKPLTTAYATTRSHFERLIEVMQIKGNSEVNRTLWPADEFANFENGDSINSFSGRKLLRQNYVRWAVIKGLDYQKKLGANPYQLGFIGGTDNHNGSPADVVEDNYEGSHGPFDSTVDARRNGEIEGWIKTKDSNPGSISGVWATKNTRGAIWDAMHDRETFVTSGTRIKPRFFGGEDLQSPDSDVRALVEQGYQRGVPMGGTLKALKKAPTFNVYASKDPDGANLDRIQIIKGWVDGKGEPQDKIFDVVWSGNRKLDAKGKLPSVGNTVDLKTAKYSNSIGGAELIGSWTDPNFDPKQFALYYVRVLEIPTPRWSTYDAVKNNLPLLKDVPATIQERAWTSPIWYTP